MTPYGDKEEKGMDNDFDFSVISDWEDNDAMYRNKQIKGNSYQEENVTFYDRNVEYNLSSVIYVSAYSY